MEILVIVIIFALVILVFKVSSNKEYDKLTNDFEALQVELNCKYDEIFKSLAIPSDCDEVNFIREVSVEDKYVFDKNKFYFWLQDKKINYFPVKKDVWYKDEFNRIVHHKTIDIDKIQNFYIDGDVIYENKISGGGGGGSSIGKAIAGSVIAGSTGAIIASRNKTDSINSELIKHDFRKLIIKYIDENDNEDKVILEHTYYEKLKKLLPRKEKAVVENKNPNNDNGDSDNILDDIKKLGELKELGLITSEEFDTKKQVLLEKIK